MINTIPKNKTKSFINKTGGLLLIILCLLIVLIYYFTIGQLSYLVEISVLELLMKQHPGQNTQSLTLVNLGFSFRYSVCLVGAVSSTGTPNFGNDISFLVVTFFSGSTLGSIAFFVIGFFSGFILGSSTGSGTRLLYSGIGCLSTISIETRSMYLWDSSCDCWRGADFFGAFGGTTGPGLLGAVRVPGARLGSNISRASLTGF